MQGILERAYAVLARIKNTVEVLLLMEFKLTVQRSSHEMLRCAVENLMHRSRKNVTSPDF